MESKKRAIKKERTWHVRNEATAVLYPPTLCDGFMINRHLYHLPTSHKNPSGVADIGQPQLLAVDGDGSDGGGAALAHVGAVGEDLLVRPVESS